MTGCGCPTKARDESLGALSGARTWILVLSFAAIGAILALHYTSSLRALGIHDLLRRLFYLPVAAAAIAGGVRFGLLAAGVTLLGYSPHLLQLAKAGDRLGDLLMEMVVLAGVATLVGVFADSSRRARALAMERGRVAALAEIGIAVMGQVEGPLRSIEGQAESLSLLNRSGAASFAVWAIQSEAMRVRRLLHDLRDLSRAGAMPPTVVNLSALVTGIAGDVSAARPGRVPIRLERSAAIIMTRADRPTLAYALRTLLLSIWDAIPQPARILVSLETSEGGFPALRILVGSGSDWLPHLEQVVSGVFGPGVSEYRFDHALCVHLLRAQGVRVTFERPSDAEASMNLEFKRARQGRPSSHGRLLATFLKTSAPRKEGIHEVDQATVGLSRSI